VKPSRVNRTRAHNHLEFTEEGEGGQTLAGFLVLNLSKLPLREKINLNRKTCFWDGIQ
jgi:hypothetical protein